MRLYLIGHRGTGKSALLHRLRGYYEAAGRAGTRCLDLDREIERRSPSGEPIGSVFARIGEPAFRQLEAMTLHALLAETPGDAVIALGAGYEGALPLGPEVRVVWVRRPSDRHGRIFLDPHRPRLDPALPPLEEFAARRALRDARYAARATDTWLMSEGDETPVPYEADFFLDRITDLGGVLTLLPHVAATPARLREFVARRLRWGIGLIELRDDLLDDAQMDAACALIPPERRLVSVRRPRASDADWAPVRARIAAAARWDWPLELGPCLLGPPSILSLHTRAPGETLPQAAARLEQAAHGAHGAWLKLAVAVHDLDELAAGHAFALRAPERHVFLPSSPDGAGRWAWYRLWRGAGSKLAFVREEPGAGTAPSADQPTLREWLERRDTASFADGGPRFAAILGDPVEHSRTPAEQREFFAARGMPVLRIALGAAALASRDPLGTLTALGLRAAAVTAPLKQTALGWLVTSGGGFALPADASPGELGACNTLGYDGRARRWRGTNTDGIGFRAACAELGDLPADGRVAIWGGGGTLDMLRTALPAARPFSARDGAPRDGAAPQDELPVEVVVWAVARSRQPACTWPPDAWRPRLVVDLNYAEDSPGREYAQRTGAAYASGLRFFRAQAEAQRAFWRQIPGLGGS